MQHFYQKQLLERKNELWVLLDANLVKHKNDLLAESNKKQDTDEDFTKTEKTLKDRLETMTKMA
jgi:hypothetical protein